MSDLLYTPHPLSEDPGLSSPESGLVAEAVSLRASLLWLRPEHVCAFVRLLHVYQPFDVEAYMTARDLTEPAIPKELKGQSPSWSWLQEQITPLIDQMGAGYRAGGIQEQFFALMENAPELVSVTAAEIHKEHWLEKNVFPEWFAKAIELARFAIHRFQISQQLADSVRVIAPIEHGGQKPHAIKLYFGKDANPRFMGPLNIFFEYPLGGQAFFRDLSKEIFVRVDSETTPCKVFNRMVHELVHYIAGRRGEKLGLLYTGDRAAQRITGPFNEAITEKLARIIITLNHDRASKLPGYPQGFYAYQKEIDALDSFLLYLETLGITEALLYSALLSDTRVIDQFYELLKGGTYQAEDIYKHVAAGKKMPALAESVLAVIQAWAKLRRRGVGGGKTSPTLFPKNWLQ